MQRTAIQPLLWGALNIEQMSAVETEDKGKLY
jgi:hypothetical protein